MVPRLGSERRTQFRLPSLHQMLRHAKRRLDPRDDTYLRLESLLCFFEVFLEVLLLFGLRLVHIVDVIDHMFIMHLGSDELPKLSRLSS